MADPAPAQSSVTNTTVVPPATPAAPADPSATNWPAVASTLLHYVAGGVILYLAYLGTTAGKLDGQLFAILVTGAAGAVGFKMSK
jgi:hypothetical protein